MLQQASGGARQRRDPKIPSQSGAARRAALTVFVMKGELQRVLQQGPEHAVGRRDKGGIQGERSGHFLRRDALKFFSLKKKKNAPKMLLGFFFRPLPKVLSFKAVETREEKKSNLYKYICVRK